MRALIKQHCKIAAERVKVLTAGHEDMFIMRANGSKIDIDVILQHDNTTLDQHNIRSYYPDDERITPKYTSKHFSKNVITHLNLVIAGLWFHHCISIPIDEFGDDTLPLVGDEFTRRCKAFVKVYMDHEPYFS